MTNTGKILITLLIIFTLLPIIPSITSAPIQSSLPDIPKEIGWYLTDNNQILCIWNSYDAYYFDVNSGIQLTNHYNNYWTQNVMMLGYYTGSSWNLLYRTDELTGFTKSLDTSNPNYINATLYKDLSYAGYNFRLAIRYSLGRYDTDLSVIPYIKNLGVAIPYQLAFGWEMKDIKIDSNPQNNYISLSNGVSYYLDQTLNNTYTTLGESPFFYLQKDCTFGTKNLYLTWSSTLDYLLQVKSRAGQYNAPVTLFIKIGTLATNEEKYTILHWHDSSTTLNPNATGIYTNLNPVGFANEYECVNDVNDATYVYTGAPSTSPGYSTYNLTDPTTGEVGLINNVTVWMRAKKDDNTYNAYMYGLILSLPEDHNGVAYGYTVLTNAWVDYAVYTFPNSYYTGKNWSWTEITGLQFGPYMWTSSLVKYAKVSKVWVVINYTSSLDNPNATLASAYNVEETTADLSARLMSDDGGHEVTCGYWVGQNSTTASNFEFNYTIGNRTALQWINKSLTNLNASTYYYAKPWFINWTGAWTNSTDEITFLTKPNPPYNLQYACSNATNITLTWNNDSAFYTINRTTVIVYKEGSYATSVDTGVTGYNGTAQVATITGLNSNTQYYFSAFSYANGSGSPFYWWYSDSYATATGATTGGTYNFTIKWECNGTNLTTNTGANNSIMWDAFNNSVIWGETKEGYRVFYNDTFTTNPFNITCEFTPDIIFFNYNMTGMIRSLIPENGEKNLTFYICCYPEYNGIIDLNSSQVWYTFSFADYTPGAFFIRTNDSHLNIYKYFNGTKTFIHQDYLSAEDTVRVALHYSERFFLGVKNSIFTVPFVQYFDAAAVVSPVIQISGPTPAPIYSVNDFVLVNTSWDSYTAPTGLWLNYTDVSGGTLNVSISFYTVDAYGVRTLNYTHYFNTTTDYFHWTTALYCNTTSNYYIEIIVNNTLLTENGTINFMIYSLWTPSPTAPIGWVDVVLIRIFGPSPLNVPYTSWITFAIAFMFLVTFGQSLGNVAFIGTGFILIALQAVFGILSTISGVVIGVGIFMIILGILFMYGGRNQ